VKGLDLLLGLSMETDSGALLRLAAEFSSRCMARVL
jgi:hypothetical protein